MRNALRLPLALFLLMVALPSAIHAQPAAVSLTPAVVVAGSPELIRVTAPADARLEGEWLGHALQFFPGRDGALWYALAGVDVEAEPGPSKLKITVRHRNDAEILDTGVAIHPAHYRTAAITVEPKFVEPGPEEQKLIAADRAVKDKVFAAEEHPDHPAQRLWSGSFLAPVKAAPTDSFGTRRTFNGKLASIHKGTDFRASTGTPVHAGNSGTVVLAQKLYYEGNCVMIDHGLGLMSISMHLSRIDVKPGEAVTRGRQVGLSGATGRVTGPHLHWAIRWQGAMLDPAKLLRMNLDRLR